MKKWLVYLLGIITGVILTFAFAFYVNLSNNSGIVGLEMFEEPGDCMEYSQFEVFQVVESGCALAHADDSFGTIVFIIPMIINNSMMTKKLFSKMTNVLNVSELINTAPKWK